MSYPVQRPVAQTTTTSSIIEYICLFTHDLKRKTKRWQDGKLKFHAFNNRVMVYDDRGGNVGDAHLSSYQTLDEGEEIKLDRGGAIVQVCEQIGAVEVDLGELVDKRAREVEKRRKEAERKAQASATRAQQQQQQQQTQRAERSSARNAHFQMLQRPLSEIMPHAPGRIGRANISKESPFEQRLQRERSDAPPPAKRTRRSQSPPSKSSHARALFGTSLTLSARPLSTWSGRGRNIVDKTDVDLVDEEDDEEGVDGDAQKSNDKLIKRSRSAPQPKYDKPIRPSSSPIEVDEERDDREKGLEPKLQHAKAAGREATGGLFNKNPRSVAQKRAPNSEKPSVPQPLATVIDVDNPAGSCKDLTPKNPRRRADKPSLAASITAAPEARKPAVEMHGQEQVDTSREDGSVEGGSSRTNVPRRAALRIKSRKRRGLLMLSDCNDQMKPHDHFAVNKEPRHPPQEAGNPSLPPKAKSKSRSLVGPEVNRANYTEAAQDVPVENHELQLKGLGNGPKHMHATSQPLDKPRASTSGEEEEGDDFEQWLSKAQPAEAEDESEGDPGLSFSHKQIERDVANSPAGMSTKEDLSNIAPESPRPDHAPDAEPRAPKNHGNVNSARESRPAKRRNPYSMVSDSENDTPTTRKRPQRLTTKASVTASDQVNLVDLSSGDSQSEDDWPGRPPAAARSRQTPAKVAQNVIAQGMGSISVPNVRVSRVSKTSKSKELIGFRLPANSHLIPGALACATTRMGWGSRPVNGPHGFSTATSVIDHSTKSDDGGTAHPAVDSKDDRSPDTDDVISDEHPPRSAGTLRLANPATRGRKAASKNDAAGKPPQILVPYEPVAVPPSRPQRAMRLPAMTTNTAAAAAEAASLSTKPIAHVGSGFVKANGGAWSHHAMDLLGMERPKGRQRA